MNDRFLTFAGWGLFAGIIALSGSIVAGAFFDNGRPEQMGYPIEGVTADAGADGEAALSLNSLLARADIAQGQRVYAKCVACHTIAPGGANGLGPNLHGVVGEPIGAGHGGYPFSDALKKKGGIWDFAALDAWFKSPREFAPGTKMTFAGLSKAEDRANLIAYLNSQGSNLPLPTADAPQKEGDGAESVADNGMADDNAVEAAAGSVPGQ